MSLRLTFKTTNGKHLTPEEADQICAKAVVPDDMNAGANRAAPQGNLVHVFFDWQPTQQQLDAIITNVTADPRWLLAVAG